MKRMKQNLIEHVGESILILPLKKIEQGMKEGRKRHEILSIHPYQTFLSQLKQHTRLSPGYFPPSNFF